MDIEPTTPHAHTRRQKILHKRDKTSLIPQAKENEFRIGKLSLLSFMSTKCWSLCENLVSASLLIAKKTEQTQLIKMKTEALRLFYYYQKQAVATKNNKELNPVLEDYDLKMNDLIDRILVIPTLKAISDKK